MYIQVNKLSEQYPKWLFFIGLVTALGPISMDMYLPVFPKILTEFGASQSLVQCTVTAFLAGLASGQLICGPLSDRIGRKLPLCVGIFICTVPTCILSGNHEYYGGKIESVYKITPEILGVILLIGGFFSLFSVNQYKFKFGENACTAPIRRYYLK